MKQFIVLCVFVFSLAPVHEVQGFFASIIYGSCPPPTRISQPFDLKQFLGNWYEIKSTQPISDKFQRCIQANYKLDIATGNVVVNNSGVDAADHRVFSVGTAKPTDQDNVYQVKFFPSSLWAQFWVVDTDYKGYALVVSCNNILGTRNFRDVWILSRRPELDVETVKALISKLDSVGMTGTRLHDTLQNC